MARKKKTRKVKAKEPSPEILKHIHELGLSSVKEYKNWCRHRNLVSGLDKDSNQLQNELYISKRAKAKRGKKGSRCSKLNTQNLQGL